MAEPLDEARFIGPVEAVLGGARERLPNDVVPEGLGRLRQDDALARDGAADLLSLHLLQGVDGGNVEDHRAVLARVVGAAPERDQMCVWWLYVVHYADI